MVLKRLLWRGSTLRTNPALAPGSDPSIRPRCSTSIVGKRRQLVIGRRERYPVPLEQAIANIETLEVLEPLTPGLLVVSIHQRTDSLLWRQPLGYGQCQQILMCLGIVSGS